MNVIRTAVVCWAFVFSIFGSFGCGLMQHVTPKDKPQLEAQPEQLLSPVTPKITYYTHIIKWPRENLIRIARWYTGSDKNWLLIAKANPSIEPNRIKIGDSILIPENLMKTHEPMPSSYLPPVVSLKKKEPQKIKEAPEPATKSHPNTAEVELFGPIDTETQPSRIEGTDSSQLLETIE